MVKKTTSEQSVENGVGIGRTEQITWKFDVIHSRFLHFVRTFLTTLLINAIDAVQLTAHICTLLQNSSLTDGAKETVSGFTSVPW